MLEEDRINKYQDCSQYTLLPKIPVIIKVQCRNFEKLSKAYDKPFSDDLNNSFASVLYKLCLEVEGVVFGYNYADNIILICRNDQSEDTVPWYGNNIQKICSTVSSITTLQFYKSLIASDNGFDVFEDLDVIFSTTIYNVPNCNEAFNVLTLSQYENLKLSTYNACFNELISQNLNKDKAETILYGMSIEDRIRFLKDKFNIDYYSYPDFFRLGQMCCRVPKLVNDKMKFKWALFKEIPVFTEKSDQIKDIISGNSANLF